MLISYVNGASTCEYVQTDYEAKCFSTEPVLAMTECHVNISYC
jgi:hypothetical protein